MKKENEHKPSDQRKKKWKKPIRTREQQLPPNIPKRQHFTNSEHCRSFPLLGIQDYTWLFFLDAAWVVSDRARISQRSHRKEILRPL